MPLKINQHETYPQFHDGDLELFLGTAKQLKPEARDPFHHPILYVKRLGRLAVGR